ncbi:EF-hand calcium-binding domain-containing protein 6 isoform X2 [Denticeps clupeoides]|nr:EF-hand calcium-binding domain-containing protein 6 isoform X2 [Denticeps clupeoides]
MSSVASSLGLEKLYPTSRGLVIAPRPMSSHQPQTRNILKRKTLRSESVQSVADQNLSVADLESLLPQKVEEKKGDLKAAFEAFDTERSFTITKGEFRRVIEHFLIPLNHSQFEGLLVNVPKKSNGSIAYLEFLQRYSRFSTKTRLHSATRSQQNLSLGVLQCRLKDKIGNNLKNITRAFRLFDFNRDGQIQQHELRRVLESYCFPMSHLEFQRLWSHYSPNNKHTLSYRNFLERLGTDCDNYRKLAPDSVKLALNWDAVSQEHKIKPRKCSWATPDTSVETLDEIHAKFLKKMRVNNGLVLKALKIFDVTGDGFVSQEDLKSVLSSFLFPMNHSTFQSLLSRFRISTSNPVEWKKFLDLFVDKDQPSMDMDPVPSSHDPPNFKVAIKRLQKHVQEVYPLLKRAFMVFDENKTGVLTQAEVRRVLEALTFCMTDQHCRRLLELLDTESTGVIDYQHFLDIFHSQNSILKRLAQKKSGAPPAQKLLPQTPMEPTDTWATVQAILRDKLSEQQEAVLKSLTQLDQAQNGTVSLPEFQRVVQNYGLPLSDLHFHRLSAAFVESGVVHYKKVLKNLGVLKRSDVSRSPDSEVERLQECLTTSSQDPKAALEERYFKKIKDDCRLNLDTEQSEVGGPISHSEFTAKFEESRSQEISEDTEEKKLEFLSAEICMSQLKKRIKDVHGDLLTAFHLMDWNHDGLVDRNDFRNLYNSLMFVMMEKEYQRLLDLMGLRLGATLNYSEFLRRIHSVGRRSDHLLDQACEQVHNYLILNMRNNWPELSKAFFSTGADAIITKKVLKDLLYKYPLPISPREFEKLWMRYDEGGKGFITQSEFLLKMTGLSEGKRSAPGLTSVLSLPDTSSEPQGDGTIPKTPNLDTLLKDLRKCLKNNFEDMNATFIGLEKSKGYIPIDDLLLLLGKHGFQTEQTKLTHLLDTLGIKTHINKVSYLDFLEHLVGCPDSVPVVESTLTGSQIQSPFKGPEVTSRVEGEDGDELSPNRALQKLRELVTTSSETLHKAFVVFDKTKDGAISLPEFRRVLDSFCIKMSDLQFKHLLVMLGVKEGEGSVVNWKEFLHDFHLNQEETSLEWLDKVDQLRFPHQIHPLSTSDVLQRIQDVVSTRIHTIAKDMVDLDYAQINLISKEDFRLICDRHFMRLTCEQLDNLWNVLPVNSSGNLEYRKFLKVFSDDRSRPVSQKSEGPTSLVPSTATKGKLVRRPKTASSSTGSIM